MIVSKCDKCGAETADASTLEEYGFWTTTTITMRCQPRVEAHGPMNPSGDAYTDRVVRLPEGNMG
jgi:hypothetical protein